MQGKIFHLYLLVTPKRSPTQAILLILCTFVNPYECDNQLGRQGAKLEVIYWQLSVAGSIVVAFLFGSRRYAMGAAGLWTLWTLVMLGYGPLVILQLFSAWGTFFAIDAFTKQSRQIDEFKAVLAGFQKDEREALAAARDKGRFSLLTDSDHYHYMLKEIDRAETSVLILSGWISDKVIDKRFLNTARRALERGVRIYLGFGFESSDGQHELSRPAKRALLSLEQLHQDHSQIRVGKFNNHQKALVIDRCQVVCGSHNWLSNRAFKNREQSFIIHDNDAAEAVFLHASPLVTENPAFGI